MDEAMKTSARADWRTPEKFLELVRQVGAIEYDPASQRTNPTKAKLWAFVDALGQRHHMDEEHRMFSGGGLTQDWSKAKGLVFCNPPYGHHLRGAKPNPDKDVARKNKETGEREIVGRGTGWAAKMARHTGEGLYLVPSRTETAWWRRLQAWCDWSLLWSSPSLGARLRFDDGKNTAPFPSTVFYKGPNVGKFLDVFGPHGTMIPGDRTLKVLIQAGLRSV